MPSSNVMFPAGQHRAQSGCSRVTSAFHHCGHQVRHATLVAIDGKDGCVKGSTRYGLVGIGALSLLSGVHWLRGIGSWRSPASDYLLGVTPNFATAIAVSFVLLSIWADQRPSASFSLAARAFLICASISGLGLLGWELFQKTSRRFVFDPHDAGATLVGIGAASLLFYWLTPRPGGSS